MAPTHVIDPIQEISMSVNGPDANGVLSDLNIGSAGENQPRIVPYPSIIKLAEKN